MKADIDRLMQQRNLDGFLVLGDPRGATMRYLTGGAFLEGALLVKRQGEPVTLIHGSMERDTAAATGLQLLNRDTDFKYYEIHQAHKGDALAAQVEFLRRVFERVELSGRVGIYGLADVGESFRLFNWLQDILPDVELVGEYGRSLFTEARETKDAQELAELAKAGKLTCQVVGEVREFIQEHPVRNETVMRTDDEPLTIGDVKAFIRQRYSVHGLVEDHENIFAQGRDAGVPHNAGNHAMPLRLGQSIVFDIFPTVSSGYFHDMTRTWCLGYAPDAVQEAWDQCKEIFDKVMAELAVGKACRDFQLMTCEYFESKGHRTSCSHPGTQEGYVHSLGHGIGLDIHEAPGFRHSEGNTTLLQPGHVVTIEPGLYYPERGFGIRIEDSVAFDEAGELIKLTDFPYDLVIPMG
jgi:Xaa-Pro aminopeptidase